jgi:hypothetical protein
LDLLAAIRLQTIVIVTWGSLLPSPANVLVCILGEHALLIAMVKLRTWFGILRKRKDTVESRIVQDLDR